MKIEIVTPFSHRGCDSCPAQEDCAAGQLVRDVESDLHQAASEAYYEHEEEIVAEAVAGGGLDQFNKLRRSLASVRNSSRDTWSAFDNAITDIVDTVNLSTSKHIQPDNQQAARERIIDGLADAPHPTGLLGNTTALDYRTSRAVDDIIDFSRQGICEAVGVKIVDQ